MTSLFEFAMGEGMLPVQREFNEAMRRAKERPMTDEKPTEVPPWLERLSAECNTPDGAAMYAVPVALWQRFTMSNHHISPWAMMESWLRWRSGLAAALGLVEREKVAVPTALNPWDPHAQKTVVAELRAQADAVDKIVPPTSGYDAFVDALARASDLLRTRAKDVGDSIACYFLLPARCGKAVAAELRAQADAIADVTDHARMHTPWGCGAAEGRGDAVGRLRARADEIDPQETP